MIEKLKNLKNHAGFMKYFKNTSWMMAEQMLRLVAGLFVGVWVARFLGPAQFGVFSYVLSYVAIFGVIAKLGLEEVVIKELVSAPSQQEDIISTVFWIKLFGALATFLVIVFLLKNTGYTKQNLYILIVATGLLLLSV